MLENIAACQRCELNLCQAPLLDQPKKDALMVVGISAKKTGTPSEIPLDNSTKSGQLVAFMEKIAGQYDLEIYRTNLVKCPPLGEDHKIRDPAQAEIEACFENMLCELNVLRPRIVILFGNLVQSAFRQRLKLDIEAVRDCTLPFQQKDGCCYVASYHPSYVMRSTLRKERYLENFSALLKQLLGQGR